VGRFVGGIWRTAAVLEILVGNHPIGATMNTRSFFSRICRSSIPRLAAVMLAALTWSSLAFCGEIHDAAEAGDLDKIKTLRANGVDINAKDSDGWSAIEYAAVEAHADCVKFLISAHADLNTKDKNGITPLWQVIITEEIFQSRGNMTGIAGHADCLRLLIAAGTDVTDLDKRGFTPLIVAAIMGNSARVKALAAEHTDVDVQDKTFGLTALMMAADHGDSDCINALLAAHADLNAADMDGWTALKYAVAAGHTDCAKALIAAHADVNTKDIFGITPLKYAACAGYTDCVKALIAAGSDVKTKDIFDNTVLMWAANSGNTDCVKALVAAGAEVKTKNSGGETALVWSVYATKRQVMEQQIWKKGPGKITSDNAQVWTIACKIPTGAFSMDCIKALVAAGSDVNARNSDGNTALNLAKDHADIVAILKGSGAEE
jgi:ankyrin repeat protein